jgi:hypothetical protein
MLSMFKELNPFKGEVRAKGLGKRELPENPNSSLYPFRVDHLSKNAKIFWEQRGYGAFAVSILTDQVIKMVVGELGHEETQLFVRYLIGKLAADDRQAVGKLPKDHTDRKAYAEIFWYEKRRASEIVEDMVCSLEEKTGSASAEEAVGLISEELVSAADDVKRIFFRKLTKEVGAVERDQLIASRLRSRVEMISRIKEKAITKND